MMTMGLDYLQEELIDIANLLKEALAKLDYENVFQKKTIYFDNQGIPTIDMVKKETDLCPPISAVVDWIEYEDHVFFRDVIIDKIRNSLALDYFTSFISAHIDLQRKDTESVLYYLFSVLTSCIQEHVNNVGGYLVFRLQEIDEKSLVRYLDKYLNFFIAKRVKVSIIVPLVGVFYKKKFPIDSSELIFDQNVKIRRLTEEEQRTRLYESVSMFSNLNQDTMNTAFQQKTSAAIEIEDDIVIDKFNLSNVNTLVGELYKAYFSKINTLINLISLNQDFNNISVENAFFKIEGYLLNTHSRPKMYWNRIRGKSFQLIDLSYSGFRPFFNSDCLSVTNLNLEEIKKDFDKVYMTSHKDNRRRLEGAFFRRTKAIMDNNGTEGLLDSVIGIEQMFGSRQRTELRFRLSLYAANLLYGDKEFSNRTKKEIFIEFRELYDKRSSVVHAGLDFKDAMSIIYLERIIYNVIKSEDIDLTSSTSISAQIEDLYIFI
ncbi:HEPN domain-containing protein [Exiguobacterium chiriqhucha]|uniref:HEPN domain-containing protein n=1 Tax=Exiguobacterium chiriqhucha TaxID=1385984 RepID=UPI0004954BD3|nr:HEPN domain-containing protein [Exiguobacterium chiriqhucha]